MRVRMLGDFIQWVYVFLYIYVCVSVIFFRAYGTSGMGYSVGASHLTNLQVHGRYSRWMIDDRSGRLATPALTAPHRDFNFINSPPVSSTTIKRARTPHAITHKKTLKIYHGVPLLTYLRRRLKFLELTKSHVHPSTQIRPRHAAWLPNPAKIQSSIFQH